MHHSKHLTIALLTLFIITSLSARSVLSFEEIQIPGISEGESVHYSILGLPFANKPVYSGQATVQGDASLSFKYSVWMDYYDFESGQPLYVEILEGAVNVGTQISVKSHASKPTVFSF